MSSPLYTVMRKLSASSPEITVVVARVADLSCKLKARLPVFFSSVSGIIDSSTFSEAHDAERSIDAATKRQDHICLKRPSLCKRKCLCSCFIVVYGYMSLSVSSVSMSRVISISIPPDVASES